MLDFGCEVQELVRPINTANSHIQRTWHPKLFFAGVARTKVKPKYTLFYMQTVYANY